jgi:hypothetical protein
MSIIDQDNWNFTFTHDTPMEVALGTAMPDTMLSFPTATDLVHYLAHNISDHGPIQRMIGDRIKADPVARVWHNRRTRLGTLKHFPHYRKDKYDRYHAAARARALGNATSPEIALVQGLETEIDRSRIIVPVGQILFHGRANREITMVSPYPTFVSTSLEPVVAFNSALRRAGVNNEHGQPVVYILTLRCELPALWGHTNSSFEFEVLLPPLLTCVQTREYKSGSFDVVEADIITRR